MKYIKYQQFREIESESLWEPNGSRDNISRTKTSPLNRSSNQKAVKIPYICQIQSYGRPVSNEK